MMKSIREVLMLVLALLWCLDTYAEPLQCRPYKISAEQPGVIEKFDTGLLWEISLQGRVSGYVFGTIHVDDPAVLDLPPVILESLDNSTQFAMEIVPSATDMEKFSTAMFFMDGRRLDMLIPAALYRETVGILHQHKLSAETVALLKPWAAFILMSYPENDDAVLDIRLMEEAQQKNLQVSGLETVDEQVGIFDNLDMKDQITLLVDTVCHYETTATDLDQMKSLYLARDLQGLVAYSHRYRFEDNSVYDHVYEQLVDRRNLRMVERLLALLVKGTTFIAVGAMHLPGENGILRLLERQNYTIKRLY